MRKMILAACVAAVFSFTAIAADGASTTTENNWGRGRMGGGWNNGGGRMGGGWGNGGGRMGGGYGYGGCGGGCGW